LLGLQQADFALAEIVCRPDPGVRDEAEHVSLAAAAELILVAVENDDPGETWQPALDRPVPEDH
jgi:hypothetical protein